jgi:peptidoglycan/LPS O-acetylase OafA/YrhL
MEAVTERNPSSVKSRLPISRNVEIDVLRGIAISSVILLHCWVILPWPILGIPDDVVKPVIKNGYYGVSIFFVISGYLITSRILETGMQRFSARKFYVMRFGRIFPCLILMVGAMTLMTILRIDGTGGNEKRSHLFNLLLSIFTFRANRYFLAHGFETYGKAWDVLWSLSVEEVFYLTVPLAVKVFGSKKLWCILLVGIVLYGPFHRFRSMGGLYDYAGCFDLIGLGCLTAIAARQLWTLKNRALCSNMQWLGIGLIIWCYLFRLVVDNHIFGPTVVGFGTALFIFARSSNNDGYNLFQKCLANLGRLSYEVYLFHSAFLLLMLHYARVLGLYHPNVRVNVVIFPVYLLAVICLASIISRFYSEPLNRWIRKKLS